MKFVTVVKLPLVVKQAVALVLTMYILGTETAI